jgi:S-adenosylmethionine uptake transporter
VFYRGIVSVVFMAVVLRASGTALRTPVPMMHVWRSAIGILSLSAWFYAIAHLPVATAMTLNYMSGVWVAAFIVGGGLLYGQAQRQGPLLGTVLLGFIGVVMTLRPTIDQNQLFAGDWPALRHGCGTGLHAGHGAGKVGEQVRTTFYFSVGTIVVGAVGALFTDFTPWSEVSFTAAAWVIPIRVLASLGQWCMTRAYSHGATLVVASMQYSGIVFAAIYSLALFGDQIAPIGWAGIAVIVTSGILATALRAMPDTPPKTTTATPHPPMIATRPCTPR